LRGFETPSNGKTKSVWVFKKEQPAYSSSTQDVAAERYFYSELSTDGSPTLDDQITDYENELVRLLILLRETPVNSAVDATIAAELITHLTIRGAHLRDVFALGVKELSTGIANIFTNEDQMRALLGIDADAPTPMLREEIKKVLSEKADILTQTGLPEPIVRQMAFTLVKENFHHFYANQSPELMSILNEIACNAGSVARRGHAKALTSSLKPESRVAALSHFSWTIRLVPEGGLILPDCVAVVIQSDSNAPEPYMMGSADKIDVVLCPICANRLLIGHRANATLPDVQGFNEAAAACSHTFFVSATRTPELEKLAERIGERSTVTVLDAVTSAVNEFMSKSSVVEHQSQSPLQSTEGPVSSEMVIAMEKHHICEASDAQISSYPVKFHDCADQETAQRIAAAVHVVVSEMSRSIPLGRLDCITFAGDYAGALRDLERGFSASKPLVPTEEDWGVGVAMAPLVMRDGIAKVSIVMRAWLGHALISEDHAAQTKAIHTLANQLAHVACVDQICRTVPEMLLSRVEDGWEARLYVHMHEAWTAYFASRISARFDPEIGGGYCDILLTALERVKETIPRERLAYRRHGDLEQFLESAILPIGMVVTYAGMLLGHCDGLGQSVYDDRGSLTQVLEKIGLRAWVDAFRRDLAGLFERRDEWESVQEFLALNRHIERVLWQFGVVPWRNDQGEVRVEIPLGTDIAQLLEEKDGRSTSSGTNEGPAKE
jgi:hypothetical protein